MAPFDSNRFERLLETRAIGRELVYRLSVDSTMVLARELAAAGAPHGTAVLAEEQTAGRGRRGRSFESPAGENIYVTLVLRLAGGTIRRLPLAVPTAVCAAIEAESVPARIKWPNDIWIDGRKTCGMLIDLDDAPGGFVAFPGIGINVNGDPTLIPELRDTATSIRLAAGRHIDREALLARLCNHLEAALESWDAEQLSSEYRARSLVLGQRVTVSGHGAVLTGIAAAVLDDGSLQVRRDDGSTESVNAGDVSLRPA
jgi:BirA family biotin operon repressor/biotin-[acetyl-CoA-carboxylase] ligase